MSLALCSPLARAEEAKTQPVKILPPEQTINDLRAYLRKNAQRFVTPTDPEKWTTEAERLRQRVLKEVIFRGVPESWRTEKTNVVWQGTIKCDGYVIRKLRYEVVPGFWAGGLLYEPNNLTGKVPAVLNVNGHVGGPGMTQDYEQSRSINLAKRGILSFHPEWIGMGQLGASGYNHHGAQHLELCGVAGVSIHYLELKRGLDILLEHKNTDPERVAVTGLSGGGWQTITISSLDTRVKLSAPNAGYMGIESRIMNAPDMGDEEQAPTDLSKIADYVYLTAMLAPRPTLLINNAKDTCCFRADRAKVSIYEPIIPVFAIYNKPDCFEFHINTDPGDHNYAQDNREAFYKFLNRHFLPEGQRNDKEIPVDKEIRKQEELAVEYPPNNADFFTLAAEFARNLPEHKFPGSDSPAVEKWRSQTRDAYSTLLRLVCDLPATASKVTTAIPLIDGANGQAWHLHIISDWTIPVMEYLPASGEAVGTTVILAGGLRDQMQDVVKRAIRDKRRVILADLLLMGECTPEQPASYLWSLLISSIGDRPLVIQERQFESLLNWINKSKKGRINVITRGRVPGLAALAFAALHRGRLESLELQQMDASLKDLIAKKIDATTAPSVFCPDLLKVADIADLIELARPTKVERKEVN